MNTYISPLPETCKLGTTLQAHSSRGEVWVQLHADEPYRYAPARGDVREYVRECARDMIEQERAAGRLGWWASQPLDIAVMSVDYWRGGYTVVVYWTDEALRARLRTEKRAQLEAAR